MIVQDTELAQKYSRDELGGKGFNLLRLAKFSRDSGLFRVPPFFIIPENIHPNMSHGQTNHANFKENSPEIEEHFSKLSKPVIVRSSQPQEDGENASFAGMFCSIPDVKNFKEFGEAAFRVINSVFRDAVGKYAERMGIHFEYGMALIVQQQITDSILRGTIQVENDGVTLESFGKSGGRSNHERENSFLEEYNVREMRPLGHIGEGHYYMLMNLARDAKKSLGLEGIVQVEFCLNPQRKPDFVQIRKLPDVKSLETELNLDIPEDAPRIEGKICNGIAGELTLPAYVTVSPFGISQILISQGYGNLLGSGYNEERIREFEEKTKLANNQDFFEIREISQMRLTRGPSVYDQCDDVWRKGNSLFNDYILVCDQLNESCVGMADLTTNKRAIITCGEESKTSHAMTVARDLGIMCMGLSEDMHDLNRFFYQVESGDMIHMKSDGKNAVAYIQKRRDKDPFGVSLE